MNRLLGLMLVCEGIITMGQLSTALHYQAEHGGLIGEILVKFYYLNTDTIDFYLEKQQRIREKAKT